MIPYDVTLVVLLADEVGICSDQVSNIEKRGFHSIVLKHSKDLWCVIRVRTIVKGQRNFRQMSIAKEEWIVQHRGMRGSFCGG